MLHARELDTQCHTQTLIKGLATLIRQEREVVGAQHDHLIPVHQSLSDLGM